MSNAPVRTWLITGSSRGLGRALAEAVLAAGDHLVATARDTTQLADLASVYKEQLRTTSLDVTDEVAAAAAVDLAVREFGQLDVLANNAGYGNVSPVEDTAIADYRAQIETNLFGTIIVTKAALPVMREQRSGHILQLSSVGGRIGPPGRSAYSAAKFGIEGFSESLANEVAPLGIHVTIIEPGGFRTDFAGSSTKLTAGRPEYDSTVGAMMRFQKEHDGKQPGDPARAAAVILHLTHLEQPPLRLALGSDAYNAIERSDTTRLDSLRAFGDLSRSTDFAASAEARNLYPWETIQKA